jgi:hypothetical protein
MSDRRPGAGRRLQASLVAFLCAVAFAQAWSSLRHKSMTFDEATYIPSGYSYVVTGDYRLNPEHPPLMKLLSGIGLLRVRPALDTTHPTWDSADQWGFSRHFFDDADIEIERVVSAARLPTVLVLMLLVIGAYALARELYGPTAGVLAAWLCAFSPNLLAHGRLATNDLGHAAFALLTVYTTLRFLRRPSPGGLALAGITLGLALLTKYTAVLLLGLVPIWAVALAWSRPATPLPASRWLDRAPDGPPRRLLFAAASVTATFAIAALVVSLGYRTPGRVDSYLAGLGVLYTNVNLGIPAYFNGRFHPDGLPYYFIAAFLLKTPSAFLVLLAVRMADQAARRDIDRDTVLFLAAPALLWLVVISATALPFGVRYILPIYPLAFVYGAGIVASPSFRRRGMGLAVAALGLAFAIGSLRAHPHYLPYFNVFAGGPERGIEWLDDSNVDWGQDLPLLAEYLDERGIEDAVVAPMAWYDPALYGVRGRVVGPAEILTLLTDPDAPPGVYAVSAHLLTRGRYDPSAAIDPLRDLRPVAILGHSIYVYER